MRSYIYIGTIPVLNRTNHSFAFERDRQFYKRSDVMFLIEQYMFYSDSINTGNHNLHDSHTPSEISLSEFIH